MSSESKRPSAGRPAVRSSDAGGEPRFESESPWLRGFDALFRFLASLKLAVISLSMLAGVLAFATVYETRHGTAAVQEEVYRSPFFAVLLTFLGLNILCAALIRYPWTKRQTGFVITHAGLLVVLLGSWISFNVTDDGQVGMVEGDTSQELVRIDKSTIWVQPVDAGSGEPSEAVAYKLPFRPGSFPWESSKLAPAKGRGSEISRPLAMGVAVACGAALVGLGVMAGFRRLPRVGPWVKLPVATLLVLGTVVPIGLLVGQQGPRSEVLTTQEEPFRLVVKDYHPASSEIYLDPKPGPGGVPMLQGSLFLTPPNSDEQVDVFERFDDGTRSIRWLQAKHPKLARAARDLGLVLFTFQYATRPELVEDFLTLPDDPLKEDLIRVHYRDLKGQPRLLTWPKDKPEGSTLSLPGSDLSITFEKRTMLELDGLVDHSGDMTGATGEQVLRVAEFQVRRGPTEPVKYMAFASLPAVPSNLAEKDPLVQISYYHPPDLGQVAMQGRSSVIEVLGTPDGHLYYRAFSREGLRGKGPIEVGKSVELVNKSSGQPVTYALRIEKYLTSGVPGYGCDALELAPNQRDGGIPAALVELTTGEGEGRQTKEVWVRRMRMSHDFRHLFKPLFDFVDENHDGRDDRDGHIPRFETVTFDNGEAFRVGLDFDRRKLGFEIKLTDFEMGTDPGTMQAASYKSDVQLTDSSAGVSDRPVQISMNEPLTWKDHTFYQSNFDRVRDPRGRETGQFISVFQVRYDPDWCWGTVYGGCVLVVLGTFVQFYMRAGLFSDGGKREREREARKSETRASKLGGTAHSATVEAVASAAPGLSNDEPL